MFLIYNIKTDIYVEFLNINVLYYSNNFKWFLVVFHLKKFMIQYN